LNIPVRPIFAESTRPAIDSFGGDERAESAAQHHDRVKPATTYSEGTGGRLGLGAATITLALVTAFFVVQHLKGRQEALLASMTAERAGVWPSVEVIKVELAPPTQVLTLPGETKGWYSSTIYARVNGYIAKWDADIGDRVKKDQVLAMIDTPELDAQHDAVEAQVKASEAEVHVREANVQFAKTTYARWQDSPKGVVSDQERENKKAQYAVAIAELNAARARVKLDQANVNRLTDLTQFKKVTAPYDGVITSRHVDIGDLVTAGSMEGNASLYGIAQSEQIRVVVNVPQAASADLNMVAVARVTTSYQSKRVFDGKIARTSKSINPQARTMRVEIDLLNPDHALLPGMYVQVEFQLKPTSFVRVPASAMLLSTRGRPQVAVIDDGGRIRFKDVTIGRDYGDFVEIESGIAEGEKVALNVSNQIATGDRVTLRGDERTATR
jgi:RND family efflux transporter MFP subunit